ncbi:MAG: pentapeptide repeat-containing protein [Clostridiales bacterium]
MTRSNGSKKYFDLASKLKIDCAKCSGLCCVALYCMKTDGFPEDKEAGKPCKNLMPDFRCAIHSQLAKDKMRGCLAYDCFGAGQMVTQLYYPNKDWLTKPKQANEIFEIFLIVFQLHQMLWYLIEAFSAVSDKHLISNIEMLICENQQMTSQCPNEILNLDVEKYRSKVNQILKKVIESIAVYSANGGKSKDFFGKNFKKANLDGRDFSMSFLIGANLEECSLRGANFLGADMRDAGIQNTDLSQCIFLTQMQINSAKGNANTKIPINLSRPTFW